MIQEDQYHRYVEHLLKGEGRHCEEIVRSLLERDISVKSLYVDLFQRSMYEVGDLWEHNRISVAVEHLATSVTQKLMNVVYPLLFAGEKTGRKAAIACVANEYHQLGSRMVADIFELNGWDGYFLGSDTPVPDLLDFIEVKEVDILCLSVSVTFNFAVLNRTIETIRHAGSRIPVLLGGQAFRWGGWDIQERFEDVRFIPSIDMLEQTIIKDGI